MIAAIIRVREPSGALRSFLADDVEIDHGLVTASGIWRDTRDRGRRKITWSATEVLQIRWTRQRETVA